jgi:hypothetical protein
MSDCAVVFSIAIDDRNSTIDICGNQRWHIHVPLKLNDISSTEPDVFGPPA